MKQWAIMALLAVLTAGSFWLLKDLQKTLAPADTQTPTRAIAVAYAVNGRYYHADNYLQYAMDSETVTEFSNQAGTRLQNPAMRVFNQQQQLIWQGEAATAELSADKNHLTLDGGVTLVESPESERPIYARSQAMVYNAQTRRVSSDSLVTLNSGSLQQTAGAFWLDLATRTVHFYRGVNANYDPKP